MRGMRPEIEGSGDWRFRMDWKGADDESSWVKGKLSCYYIISIPPRKMRVWGEMDSLSCITSFWRT